MATVKVFYKREAPMKRFFARDVKVRSFAHGEDVSKEFLDWREYFLKSVATYKDKFRPFSQKHFYGEPLGGLDKGSPVRGVNGERYELLADGVVALGGKRTGLQVGTETKAWSLVSIPRREGQVTAVAVIGKPMGSAQMQLAVYKSTGGRLDAEPYCSVPLEFTLDAESYLITLGRHFFLVHNFTLDYYYFNYEAGELERVAIGEDEENQTLEWCKFVAPRVVANDGGYVFWNTEDCVYGFPIGYPNHLVKFPCPMTEKISNILCEGERLTVFRQDKNSSKISAYRYGQSGAYFKEIKD